MNAKRFKKLIEAVRMQPAKLFNMSSWQRTEKCGTVCCAVGSYCAKHPRAALKLVAEPIYGWPIPTFDGTISFEAVAEYFGIDVGESHYLFHGESYARPQKSVVLKRLEGFYRRNLTAAA